MVIDNAASVPACASGHAAVVIRGVERAVEVGLRERGARSVGPVYAQQDGSHAIPWSGHVLAR